MCRRAPAVNKNSKPTNRRLNELVKCFASEVPASRAAKAMGINRHSAERAYQIIRRCLARECELHSPPGGEVEADGSYFGGRRKGPRGRGAAGQVPVFGLLKRDGKVHTRVVEDVSRKTLRRIIRTRVVPESVISADSSRPHGGPVLDGFKHFRINHRGRLATAGGSTSTAPRTSGATPRPRRRATTA